MEKVLISTQHEDGVEPKLADALWEQVVTQTLPPGLYDAGALRKEFYVNPTGRFVIGGPVGDTGLTGRKIIVDTYGGFARHGGGAFSGKDPSKVDRSASYAARHVAKNIVAAGLADRAEVQVAYAIGVARPLSLLIETFGTEKIEPAAAGPAGPRPFRPAARRPGGGAEPAAADLPPDRGLRPLRPRRARVHLGEHRQGRRPPGRGRPRLKAASPKWAVGFGAVVNPSIADICGSCETEVVAGRARVVIPPRSRTGSASAPARPSAVRQGAPPTRSALVLVARLRNPLGVFGCRVIVRRDRPWESPH